MEELKRCPFCGGENIHGSYFNWRPALMCCDCGAVMTIPTCFYGNTEKELIRRWNTRKPMERILERLEEEARIYSLGYTTGIKEAIRIVKEELN